MIDLDRIRAETPATQRLIHLNNAGASLTPAPVLDRVIGYLHMEAEVGGYEAAEAERPAFDAVYTSVARLIGADPDEIALVESATAAWHKAFYALHFEPGDRILTARAEYAANYVALLQVARRTGAVIDVIPDDEHGALDLASLERTIDDRTRLIAITWIPSNGGLVNPAAEVGRIARAHGIPYLLDACQAVGQLQVDVAELGCDMLSATGRKFLRAPRGSGFLYVRRDFLTGLEPTMLDHVGVASMTTDGYELRPDARRFETFEHAAAARLGLGAAADYALTIGLDLIEARCRALGDLLRAELRELRGLRVHDLGRNPAAIVTFGIDGITPDAVREHLTKAGINVTLSRPNSTLLDASARNLPTLLRASPHYYNTEDELRRLVSTCHGLIG